MYVKLKHELECVKSKTNPKTATVVNTFFEHILTLIKVAVFDQTSHVSALFINYHNEFLK